MDVSGRILPGLLIRALLVAGLVLLRSVPAIAETETDDDLRELLPVVPSMLPGLEEILVTAPEPRYVGPPPAIASVASGLRSRSTAPGLTDSCSTPVQAARRSRSRSPTNLGCRYWRCLSTARRDWIIDRLGRKGRHARVWRAAYREHDRAIVADAFGGAQGVLGGEGLHEKRIVIEFQRDQISIARSKRQPPPAGYSIVPFKYSPARGMRVDARVGSVPAVAISIRVARSRSATWRCARRCRGGAASMTSSRTSSSVSPRTSRRRRACIPSLIAGDMIVRNAEISFGDMHIFQHWRLDKRPALLLGMDVLATGHADHRLQAWRTAAEGPALKRGVGPLAVVSDGGHPQSKRGAGPPSCFDEV